MSLYLYHSTATNHPCIIVIVQYMHTFIPLTLCFLQSVSYFSSFHSSYSHTVYLDDQTVELLFFCSFYNCVHFQFLPHCVVPYTNSSPLQYFTSIAYKLLLNVFIKPNFRFYISILVNILSYKQPFLSLLVSFFIIPYHSFLSF